MQAHWVDIKGKWSFVLAYGIRKSDLMELSRWLEALGADGSEIARANKVIMRLNTGFTFSDPELEMSLVCIGNASSREQWWDTVAHEIDHLQNAILQHYDVESGSEEAAYLQGYLMREVVRAVGTI